MIQLCFYKQVIKQSFSYFLFDAPFETKFNFYLPPNKSIENYRDFFVVSLDATMREVDF